jgi:acetate---CoA ligase (ADP-forming)
MEAATRVSQAKPVVILKAGKTEKSQKVISSHTGALAGSDEIISAVFEKTGIIRAENLEEFFDLISLVSFSDVPKNNQIAVITNAGGPGVLATDAFRGKNIKLLEISEKTKTRLREYLPAEGSLENPVDLLGDAKEDRYKKALEIISKETNPGGIIVILTPQDQTPIEKITSKIISFKKKTDSNIVTSFVGGEKIKKSLKKLRENGILNFSFPERAVSSLDKYYSWKTETMAENLVMEVNEERKEKVAEIIDGARHDGRTALFFSESRQIMEMYGIKVASNLDILPDDLEFGKMEFRYPVVIKVDSDKVLHKTDKKGLMLGIKNPEELRRAFGEMRHNFPGERLIVQPMLPRQTEMIVGIKYDEIFGPVVVCGLGGIYTEVFRLADFFVLPLGLEEIKTRLLGGRTGFLFRETRGQKLYDCLELANIILAIAQFASETGGVKGFDINPLLIYNNGEKALAVDIKIII